VLTLDLTGLVQVPFTSGSGIRDGAESAVGVGSEFGSSHRFFDSGFRRVLRELAERIDVSVDRRTSIITLRATMPDSVAAAGLVQATVAELMRTVIAYEVRKADEQLRFLEAEYTAAQLRYERAQRDLASFSDSNRMLTSAVARIEQQRRERDASLAFEVLEQFTREREQARIKRNQDIPVFAILEDPMIPNHRSSPRRLLIIGIAFGAGLMVGSARVLSRFHGSILVGAC
jgi:uncharacterized protein involved in exopolysaccharide biosynthesis